MDTNVLLGDSDLIYIFQEQFEQLTCQCVSLLLCPQSVPHLVLFLFFINNRTYTYELIKTSVILNCHDLQLSP